MLKQDLFIALDETETGKEHFRKKYANGIALSVNQIGKHYPTTRHRPTFYFDAYIQCEPVTYKVFDSFIENLYCYESFLAHLFPFSLSTVELS